LEVIILKKEETFADMKLVLYARRDFLLEVANETEVFGFGLDYTETMESYQHLIPIFVILG
jgi:hypothetical protein